MIGWVLRQLLAQAEREYYNPANIQAALSDLVTLAEEGLIDEEEFERREDELLDRLEEAQRWANGIR
ncbi:MULTISPECIES: gas vesicle protein GvpG [unclassified Streptomyces]|uniref:gas vesicle protein GvpG n=1 Tax=unclassified Streptomyces TaxID=2593676 RepID=UPI00336AB28C